MIALVALAFADEPAVPVDDGYVLRDRGFGFCDEPGRGGPDVLELCPLLAGAPPDACPGLRRTCERGVPPEQEQGCDESDATGSTKGGVAGAPEAPPKPSVMPKLELPDLSSLASLARWVFAIGVALAILVFVRFLLRSFGSPAPERGPGPEPEAEVPVDEPLPLAPVADVLAGARAALAAGRFAEVVALCRGAALKSLSERGGIVLHRSRTDREYARQVVDAGQRTALREIVAAREAARFGASPITHEVAAAVLRAAEGLVAVMLAVLLLGAPRAEAADRYGPWADAALPLLLEEYGHTVTWRLRSLDELDDPANDDEVDVLVLDLNRVFVEDEVMEIVLGWVERGGTLWVAGEHALLPELGPLTVTPCVPEVDPALGDLLPAPVGEPQVEVYGTPGAVRVLAGCDGDAVVAWYPHGEGVVVGFAGGRWFWNGYFVHADNQQFVGDLLSVGEIAYGWPAGTPSKIQLATVGTRSSGSGAGGSNPLSALLSARLLPFVLQLLATCGVLALWRGWPFAPLRDPDEGAGKPFADHVRALGTRLQRARASGEAARVVAGYWLHRLGPAGLALAAQRAGRDPAGARAFVARVEARAGGDGKPAGDDLAFVEELWTISRGR